MLPSGTWPSPIAQLLWQLFSSALPFLPLGPRDCAPKVLLLCFVLHPLHPKGVIKTEGRDTAFGMVSDCGQLCARVAPVPVASQVAFPVSALSVPSRC